MIVIGVTGSLASGKSEVARILKRKGARVLDADLVAKGVIEKGKPVYRALLKLFGPEYLARDGRIDRKKLAVRVFSNPKDLERLNTLIHPAVIVDFIGRIYTAKSKKGILVLDVPLLYESRMQDLADVTVVVSASSKKMISRAAKKGIPARLARKILSSQWPLKKKERLADFVVRNDGSRAELERKVLGILEKIKRGGVK